MIKNTASGKVGHSFVGETDYAKLHVSAHLCFVPVGKIET